MPDQRHQITGRVIDRRTRQGIADLRVEAWNRDQRPDDLVASAITDTQGAFRMEVNLSRLPQGQLEKLRLLRQRRPKPQPQLYLKVLRGSELIATTQRDIGWNTEGRPVPVLIEVDLAREGEQKPLIKPLVVRGRITTAEGRPLVGATVRTLDRDLRREQLLGQSLTDQDGRYEIRYGPEDFARAEKGRADIIVRVLTPRGAPWGESGTFFNAATSQTVDLNIAPHEQPRLSQYEALSEAIAPVLGEIQVAELNDDDVQFLISEFAGDEVVNDRRLRILSQGARLARQTALPTEFFYGIANVREEIALPLSLTAFLALSSKSAHEAVVQAIERNIVPASLLNSLDGILARLEALRLEHGVLVRRRVTGRLINQETSAPLSDYRVQAFDLDAAAEPKDLGFDRSNARGLFTVSYTAATDDKVPRRLRLHVVAPDGKEIHQEEINVAPDQDEAIEIRVKVPAIPDPAAVPLAQVATITNVIIPENLRRFFAEKNIHALVDIRRAGGLRRLDGLPLREDDPAVQRLEAHANLTLLSADVAQNAVLISKGFSSLLSIANTTRAEFVGALHAELGDFKAAQLHAKATAQAKVLDNVLVGLQAEFANGFPSSLPGITNPALPELYGSQCSCEDCEAAVSPLAYLADLLDYAIRHLRDSGKQIDLDWLAATFHQPFGDLPVSCEAMDKKVRQVRLCIEVLRRYLTANHLPAGTWAVALLSLAQRKYRLAAYTTLLTKLGTSYEEIRLARTAEEAERKTLADRLGIDLSSATPDELEGLFLDPNASPAVLTEQELERLFGLADTTRDGLSEGVKLGDKAGAQAQITRWNLDGVEWGRDTDANGTVYLKLEKVGSDQYRISLYRDAARKEKDLVATGHRSTLNGVVKVWAKNGGDLTGTFTINYTEYTNEIEIVTIPHFLSWRLKHLRTLWTEQDHPTDAYTETAEDRLPIIDPDLIGPDDFRNPVDKDQSFGLWKNRRTWVDHQLEELADLKLDDAGNLVNVPEFAKMLERMYEAVTYANKDVAPWGGAPLADEFEVLHEQLTLGPTPEDVEAAKATITKLLRLTPESFTRLIELRAKDKLAGGGTNHEPLSPDEWREIRSILVAAQKRTFYDAWIAEENPAAPNPAVKLDPRQFWISLREPSEANWPLALPEFVLNTQKPLIDPASLGLKDLPEPTAGGEAIHLWEARRRELDAIKKELRAKENEGLVAVIKAALGDQPPGPLGGDWETYLKNLQGELNNPNSTIVAEELEKLGLSKDDFLRLMEIKAKQQPTAEEWNEVFDILTAARKVKQLFKHWVDEEKAIQLAYWRARKASLPRWRASAEERHAWQQALRARSSAPIIDPDVIHDGYLRDWLTGVGDAVQIWNEREKQTTSWGDNLAKAAAAKTLEKFDENIANTLFASVWQESTRNTIKDRREAKGLGYVLMLAFGDPLPDLDGLYDTLTATNPDADKLEAARRTITDELFVTVDGFKTLIEIKSKNETGQPQPPTNAEWDTLDKLLARAYLLGSVMGLEHEREQGNDIRARLEQLSLTTAAFNRLVALRRLVARGAPLLEMEWDEFRNILVQVNKRRAFAAWREKEDEKGIILEPRDFKFPDPPPLQFPPPDPEPLRAWRATRRDRRDWEDTLESRLDQVKTTIEAMQTAVSETEEETLPQLRDALIKAVKLKQGTESFDDKAKWVIDNLLIDAKAGGCQLTTRVAQAIETIQGLLWSIRTGQLQDTYPELALDADDFEEEWKWIGSYAPWRSAMFVFLLPENILLPNLRKWQTPAFTKLVSDLRGGTRLTPETACKAAQAYSEYLRDICTLTIEATCQTETRLHRGNCRDRVDAGKSHLFYMFGCQGAANPQTVYWSAYDPNDPDPNKDYAQTFWDPVPGMANVTQIIGAVPYEIGPGNRHIFLFVMTNEKKLVYSRYDLEKQDWEDEPSGELELPSDPGNCTILTVQRQYENKPPELAIHCADQLYTRPLNTAGTDWAQAEGSTKEENKEDGQDEWEQFHHSWLLGKIQKIHAVFSIPMLSGYEYGMCYTTKGFGIEYDSTQPGGLTLVLEPSSNQAYPSSFRGAFQWGNELYLFTGGYLLVGTAHATAINVDSAATYTYSVDHNAIIAPKSGHVPLDTVESQVAYAVGLSFQGFYRGALKPNGGKVQLVLANRVGPKLTHPFDIVEQMEPLSGPDLEGRHNEIANAYLDNETGPQSTLVYVEEAYFFVPMHLGLQLQKAGYYIEALNWFRTFYEYSRVGPRKIYYGLKQEESLKTVYERAGNWLLDPLNPHAIAASRRNTYTRFTLLSLVRCFLDYADAEFTRDTPESVPRARTLYMTALELLDTSELKQTALASCEKLKLTLKIEADDPKAAHQGNVLLWQLDKLRKVSAVKATIGAMNEALTTDEPWNVRFAAASDILNDAIAKQPPPISIKTRAAEKTKVLAKAHSAVLTNEAVAEAATAAGALAAKDLLHAVSFGSGYDTKTLEHENVAIRWLRFSEDAIATGSSGSRPNPGSDDTGDWRDLADPKYRQWLEEQKKKLEVHKKKRSPPYVPAGVPVYEFCIPPNPVIEGLRLRAELNLYKIRTCRNIAGMERQLDPYAAPTDTVSGMPYIGADGQLVLPDAITIKPTPYRYQVLIERAKRLVELAAQIESAMLSTIEKYYAEAFQMLKARQDMRIANAGVRLQQLRVREAESAKDLASLQQQRAQLERDTYEEWINAGMNQYELEMIDAFQAGATAQIAAAFFQAGVEMASASATAAPAVAIMATGKYTATSLAAEATQRAQTAAVYASFERSKQQWTLQKALAEQDMAIAGQQYKIAKDHVRVVGQEQRIADIQADHARDVMEFLANKFTGPELYDWMSGVLERVYGYFLQQATAMAQLATQQLAFERQEAPPPYIQADYWEAPAETLGAGSTNGTAPDRRGLTGSARLLQDIYKLDQHAFDTDKRKLQLTNTISLAQLSPVEFQRFRETGVMNFATPMELFDRDFPGHYLRLIKRVRTSVIALIPPTEGIRATLSATGLSRVVIGSNGLYQTVPVKRAPESVALTSPVNATGLFELTPQPGEMLLPFEGMGVDTNWELRMPRASNQLDYSAIADAVITIEYTSLDSFDYRQQVIQQFDTDFSADRPFSFRHQFADPWYDLHNPELTTTPMVVRFGTRREDFPPNLDDLKIQQVVLYFARKDGSSFEIPVTHLQFTAQDRGGTVGGGSTTIDGVISTRKGNAGSWTAMLGKSPIGEWELALPNTPEIKNRFKAEEIEDMLFVITYKGQTPAWPA